MDYSKAFEVEDGVVLGEDGVAIFGTDVSPVGSDAPIGSLAIDNRGLMWQKFDSGVNDWHTVKFVRSNVTQKPTYSSGLITDIEFFNSATQITANRIAKSFFTYSGDNVTQELTNFYGSDGTTVIRTVTKTYTYTGDDVTNITVAQS